eukprot:GEMP01002689.1.p1 GENE.GEMP01002689.1~~GEMP01002689.1.p1  ORF type:complete len:453 (-),score=80.71 GEMP01002689.1:1719-3077(-)
MKFLTLMMLLVLISVLPSVAATSLGPPRGATDITEGTTQSGHSGLAQRSNVHLEGPHDAPPSVPKKSGIGSIYDEDISATPRQIRPLPLVARRDSGTGSIGEGTISITPLRRPSGAPALVPEDSGISSIDEDTISPIPRENPDVLSHWQRLKRTMKRTSLRLRPSVTVTMRAEENDHLALAREYFASSFADPVVDPSRTCEIILQRHGKPADETHGKGYSKVGRFYTVRDTNEEVVIKWHKKPIRPVGARSDKTNEHVAAVMTDFHSQSIVHLLSQLYSAGVEEAKKVYFMQPLLVEMEKNGQIYYGLMERRFALFSTVPPIDNAIEGKFHSFLDFLVPIQRDHTPLYGLLPRDEQGWYQRPEDSYLYMTDATLEIWSTMGVSSLVEGRTHYNLPLIYTILGDEARRNFGGSARYAEVERYVDVKPRTIDENTLRQIRDTESRTHDTVGGEN